MMLPRAAARTRRFFAFGVAMAVPLAPLAAEPVDPRSASTWQIMSGRGVKQYLADRRAELDALEVQITNIDDALLEQLGRLNALRQDVAIARTREADSSARLAAVEAELAGCMHRAEVAYAELSALRSRSNSMKSRLAQGPRAGRDEKDLNALRADVVRLEKENKVLGRAIERAADSQVASSATVK